MTPEQQAAFIMAQAACAMAENLASWPLTALVPPRLRAVEVTAAIAADYDVLLRGGDAGSCANLVKLAFGKW